MTRKNKLVVFALLLVISLGLVTSLVFLVDNKSENKQKESSKNNVEAVTSVDELDASVKGGAIYLEPNAEFTMSGGVIEGHESTYGGAVYVSNGATFTMEGGLIESASATNGGAIYVATGGTCIINGGTITECTATENGGAIYVEEGGNLTIDGKVITAGEEGVVPEYSVVFSKNEAEISGGAIYMQDSTIENTLTLKNVTFSENKVKVHGGAIRVFGWMTIEGYNVSLIDNIIEEGTTNSSRGRGAGLYTEVPTMDLADGEKIKVNLKGYSYFCGNTINSCSSQPTGGAVCIYRGGSLLIEKGLIRENKITQTTKVDGAEVSGRGGAIFVYNNVDLVLGVEGSPKNSLILEENSASDTSGAIGVYYFSNATLYSTTLTGNSSKNQGGGIYATESTVSLDKSVIIDNNFSYKGGGICLYKQTSVLDINGATFDSNQLKNQPGNGNRYGAHVFASGAIVNFNSGTMLNGDKYDEESLVHGGAIALASFLNNTCKLTVGDGYISNCKASLGGGIYAAGTQIIIKKLTIDNCESTSNGGGMYIVDTEATDYTVVSDIKQFENISIQNCTSGSSGGGIYYGSTANISMVVEKINSNTAVNMGGGIFFSKFITVNIAKSSNVSKGSISFNTAGVFGGAICWYTGSIVESSDVDYTLNKIDGVLTTNTSEGRGGALYLAGENSSLTVNNACINGNSIKTNNSELQYGAGVYLTNKSSFTITSGEICNNIIDDSSGVQSRGGGIFSSSNSKVYIGTSGSGVSTVLLNNNHAYETAGAIAAYTDSEIYIYSATLKGNTSMNGGAIYSSNSDIYLQKNVLITENIAGLLGGGVRIFNTSTLTIDGASITKNNVNREDGSETYGGGIESQKSTINLNSGLISENGTTNGSELYGGGIAVRVGSTLNIKGGQISNNQATLGAGICLSGTTSGVSVVLNMTGGTIQDNIADNQGGGVFVSKGATFNFSKGSITRCSAQKGGAIYIVSSGIYSNTGGTISNCTSTTGEVVYQES